MTGEDGSLPSLDVEAPCSAGERETARPSEGEAAVKRTAVGVLLLLVVNGMFACAEPAAASPAATAPQHRADAVAGTGSPAVVTRSIPASATDPAISDIIGRHLVSVGPVADHIGRLLLFFPGTGGRPDQYSLFITRAAELGYHAVGLAYDNRDAINFQVCPGKPQECFEKARLEVLTGTESGYSPPNVDRANAAFTRLVRLLQYLDQNFPQEGWGAYLREEEPRWEFVVVAGHSQGGGHAAMTARLYEVDRVLLFDATEPAAWTRASFATPGERLFGFAHELEPLFAPIIRSWENLAIPGALTSVDGVAPPFGGSHRLSTRSMSCRGDPKSTGYYHNCPIVDEYTPVEADGKPAFQPVWDYLLTPPESVLGRAPTEQEPTAPATGQEDSNRVTRWGTGVALAAAAAVGLTAGLGAWGAVRKRGIPRAKHG